MNVKTAETFLACYRADKPLESRVAKAARMAETDEILRQKLKAQVEFDQQIVDALRSVQPSDSLLANLGRRPAAAEPLRTQLGQPAMLSAVAGVFLIIGVLVWQEMLRRDSFPGKGAVEEMIASADDLSGVELEPASTAISQLGDHFYMRGFEGFALPPDLATLPAVGTRVFRQSGRPVAQLAVDRKNALLYVFRAGDFGVRLGSGEWRIFTQGGWVAAVREQKALCTVVTFHGDRGDMQEFLATLKP